MTNSTSSTLVTCPVNPLSVTSAALIDKSPNLKLNPVRSAFLVLVVSNRCSNRQASQAVMLGLRLHGFASCGPQVDVLARRGKRMKDSCRRFLWVKPWNGVLPLHWHTTGPNSVIWPNLTARRQGNIVCFWIQEEEKLSWWLPSFCDTYTYLTSLIVFKTILLLLPLLH